MKRGFARQGLLGIGALVVAFAAQLAPLTPPLPAAAAVAAAPTCVNPIANWSLSQRIEQVIMVSGQFLNLSASTPMAAQGVGGFVFFGQPAAGSGPAITSGIANIGNYAAAGGQVTPWMSTDEEGGYVARLSNVIGALPTPRQMAAQWSTAQVQSALTTHGQAMRQLGITMDLAPVLDTALPTNTIADENDRSFSDIPSVAWAYGQAFANGLRAGGVVPVVKHYPGLGHASANPDLGPSVDPSLTQLQGHDLIPFQQAAAASLPVVMISHPSVPGLTGTVPASLSGAAYAYLRNTLHFQGVVLTDSLSALAIADYGYSQPSAAVTALEAGTDMVMINVSAWSAAVGAIQRAVSTGAYPVNALNASVARIVAAKGLPVCTPPPAGSYHALNPSRIFDTRATNSPLGPATVRTVAVAGQGGVPAGGVSAVVLNATITAPGASSYLTLYPGRAQLPAVSNLNFFAGQTVANLVEVPVGPDGTINLFNAVGYTHAVLDVEGYVAPAAGSTAGRYQGVVPNRILDTRTGVGASTQPLGPLTTIRLQVAGTPAIPATGAAAVALNLTATDTSNGSFIMVWPDGSPRPVASNLNFVAGQTVANRVIVPLGPNGAIDLYNQTGTVDLIVDVNGWFTEGSAATQGSQFFPTSPARLYDTRLGLNGVAGAFGTGVTRALTMVGLDAIPAGVKAVVLNVTVTDTTGDSYLTIWPDGATMPLASDLNWAAGRTVPNLVIVAVPADGKIDIFNAAGTTSVIVDLFGWYS